MLSCRAQAEAAKPCSEGSGAEGPPPQQLVVFQRGIDRGVSHWNRHAGSSCHTLPSIHGTSLPCTRRTSTPEAFVALIQGETPHEVYERLEVTGPICVYLDCDQYVEELTAEAVTTMERRHVQLHPACRHLADLLKDPAAVQMRARCQALLP